MQKSQLKPAILPVAALFVLLVLIPGTVIVSAELSRNTGLPQQKTSQFDDGYGSLPYNYKVLSMSSLIAAGLVHPPTLPQMPGREIAGYENPTTNINWAWPVNISEQSGGQHG